jgi:heat-inducible transcriptional repressor
MLLNERKLRIMLAIVDDYIASGVPIGSRTISRMWDGELSPATIRNEMSDLEEMGYLIQPYTSAGRIPSDAAYRLYVDRFLRVQDLSGEETEHIRSYYNDRMREMNEVLTTTARALSEMTDYVAMVLPPQLRNVTFSQIRLIPLTPGRALVIFVTGPGLVKDLIINVPLEMDERHLERISNALTHHMRGRTVDDLPQVLNALRDELGVQEQVFHALLDIANSNDASEVFFDGRQNIFKHHEYANIERAKSILEAMDSREMFHRMLSRARDLKLSISIGCENEDETLKDASVITATYTVGGKNVGSFGIVGPTRMDYGRVVAIMHQISRALNDILSG